jgi:hypothetical protein
LLEPAADVNERPKCVRFGTRQQQIVTENETPGVSMRIRIKDLPRPGELEEFDLRRFRVGEVYDVPPQLASLLIVAGYAEAAARRAERVAAADRLWKGKN